MQNNYKTVYGFKPQQRYQNKQKEIYKNIYVGVVSVSGLLVKIPCLMLSSLKTIIHSQRSYTRNMGDVICWVLILTGLRNIRILCIYSNFIWLSEIYKVLKIFMSCQIFK